MSPWLAGVMTGVRWLILLYITNSVNYHHPSGSPVWPVLACCPPWHYSSLLSPGVSQLSSVVSVSSQHDNTSLRNTVAYWRIAFKLINTNDGIKFLWQLVQVVHYLIACTANSIVLIEFLWNSSLKLVVIFRPIYNKAKTNYFVLQKTKKKH